MNHYHTGDTSVTHAPSCPAGKSKSKSKSKGKRLRQQRTPDSVNAAAVTKPAHTKRGCAQLAPSAEYGAAPSGATRAAGGPEGAGGGEPRDFRAQLSSIEAALRQRCGIC
eukprot:1195518-Prorocentrum_minimum.AAC.1